MELPEQVLAEFRARGLLVSQQPFPSAHVAYPDGVRIGKPASVPGNAPEGYHSRWGLDGPVCDAPSLVLHRASGRWIVSSEDWEPGPGPGDFVNAWDTAEQAVADILDFFFGDLARMARK